MAIFIVHTLFRPYFTGNGFINTDFPYDANDADLRFFAILLLGMRSFDHIFTSGLKFDVTFEFNSHSFSYKGEPFPVHDAVLATFVKTMYLRMRTKCISFTSGYKFVTGNGFVDPICYKTRNFACEPTINDNLSKLVKSGSKIKRMRVNHFRLRRRKTLSWKIESKIVREMGALSGTKA